MTATSESNEPLVITIDGPAGTGKSTVAHQLAMSLGLEFLDTGAMYRGAALIAIEREIDPDDGRRLADAIRDAHMRFDWEDDPPSLVIDGRYTGLRIRELDVSAIVSIVAARPEVREVMVAQQRRIASEHRRLVTEGRDQGSVVFPDAPLRFYLHADTAVRARRRVAQLQSIGKSADPDRVRRDIEDRDRLDTSRADGPLVKPEGAVEINTSNLTIDEVVDELERLSREHLPDAGFRS